MSAAPLFGGFDFGTESVRVAFIDAQGRTVGSAVAPYRHGQIVRGSEPAGRLFAQPLAPTVALQHPLDWLGAAGDASRSALRAGSIDSRQVRGIAVDFTSCTMLPCRADGTPLCVMDVGGTLSALAREPHAWPKLWKHHGAATQAAHLADVARRRGERWLSRYGGTIGLEWLFPKMLEVIERAPHVAEAAEIWLEAGDWFTWQLVGSPWLGGTVAADALPRSTCQAGYKALWSAQDGYPSREYFAACSAELACAAERTLPGRFIAPGRRAGSLARALAERLGLVEGIAVSAAIIDAHAGVPGAGVGTTGTLVTVMGTSGCHMLLAKQEREIPGVAGVVRDGILPGSWGYETGQAAMGDAFELARRLAGEASFASLEKMAKAIDAGAEGLLCLDWFNGCRTPLMEARVSGALVGLGLHHGPAHVYRAALEASAFGLRWIVETLRHGGAPIEHVVSTGGVARRNELFMEIVASVLGQPVAVHQAEHGSAQGAAILGALAAGAAAGGFDDVATAVSRVAGTESALPAPRVVEPRAEWTRLYDDRYAMYRELAAACAAPQSVSRRLHDESVSSEGSMR